MATATPTVASGGVDTLETPIAALRRLGVERSTGALEISDPTGSPRPRGRIYLIDGDVADAEATAVPGIGVRLVRAGLVPESRWRPLAGALDAGRAGWDALVELTRAAAVPDAELERVVRSATADATVALLAAASGARCRFRPGLGHWTGRAGHAAVDDLLDEAAAGLRMLAAARVGPDDTVALGPATDDGVVLGPQSLTVLVGLDEGRTPRQAAWMSGLAVLDAVAALSDLADQGACAVVVHRPRPRPHASAADLRTAPEPPAPTPPRPRGRSGEDPVSADAPAQPRPAEATPSAPVDLDPLPCRRRPHTVRPRSGYEPVVATTDALTLTRLIEGLRRE